jgi:hypothetical protein
MFTTPPRNAQGHGGTFWTMGLVHEQEQQQRTWGWPVPGGDTTELGQYTREVPPAPRRQTRRATAATEQPFQARNLFPEFERELEPTLPTLTEYMNTLNEDRKKSTIDRFKQRVTNIQAEHGGASQEKCVYTLDEIVLDKNTEENTQKFIMILDASGNFAFFVKTENILNDLKEKKKNPNGRQPIVAIAEGTFAELLDMMKNHAPDSDKGDPFWETGVASAEATPSSPKNKPQ